MHDALSVEPIGSTLLATDSALAQKASRLFLTDPAKTLSKRPIGVNIGKNTQGKPLRVPRGAFQKQSYLERWHVCLGKVLGFQVHTRRGEQQKGVKRQGWLYTTRRRTPCCRPVWGTYIIWFGASWVISRMGKRHFGGNAF